MFQSISPESRAQKSAVIFRATRFCRLASAYRASEIPTLLNRENPATGREKKKESRFEIINLSADDDHSISPQNHFIERERKKERILLTISSGDKTPN